MHRAGKILHLKGTKDHRTPAILSTAPSGKTESNEEELAKVLRS